MNLEGLANIEEVVEDIVHLNFPTQELLCSTFLRFQEHYESPKFKGKIFTLDEFKEWYTIEKGSFSYYTDWSGFNIPSYVLNPFYEGKFNPLEEKEKAFLEYFKEKQGKFYIIGTYGDEQSLLEHEIAHGLFYINDDYREEALKILSKVELFEVYAYLQKLGYHQSVWEDEAHAYLLSDVERFSRKRDFNKAHKKLKKLFSRYSN